jgi:hypothetical protein
MEVPEGEPTHEEIREMCAEIRKGWTNLKSRDAKLSEIVPWEMKVLKSPKGLG